jgi:hypothetical protein
MITDVGNLKQKPSIYYRADALEIQQKFCTSSHKKNFNVNTRAGLKARPAPVLSLTASTVFLQKVNIHLLSKALSLDLQKQFALYFDLLIPVKNETLSIPVTHFQFQSYKLTYSLWLTSRHRPKPASKTCDNNYIRNAHGSHKGYSDVETFNSLTHRCEPTTIRQATTIVVASSLVNCQKPIKKVDAGRPITVIKYSTFSCSFFSVFLSIPNQ